MPGLQLALRAVSTLPLDECLVGTVTLTAEDQAATVSARLNLIEGDLVIVATGSAGYAARCAWPWPVDAMHRRVDLAPGRHLVGTVPLIATDTSAPLFPSPGDYVLTATFDAARGVALSSPPISVRRTAPQTEAQDAALRNRDVLQSLLSASVLGSAADGLALLGSAPAVTTQTLSGLARDRLDDVVASVDPQSFAEIVLATAGVLPAGIADADPRRDVIERLIGSDAELQAIFRGIPY